jgi:hypothetical protein
MSKIRSPEKVFIRKSDGEVITLNEDGKTYSMESSKKEFPNNLHPKWKPSHLQNQYFEEREKEAEKNEVTFVLMPPEERSEHGQGYDATCEICYFLELEFCEDIPDLFKLCGESNKGYFVLKKEE